MNLVRVGYIAMYQDEEIPWSFVVVSEDGEDLDIIVTRYLEAQPIRLSVTQKNFEIIERIHFDDNSAGLLRFEVGDILNGGKW